MDCCDLLDLLVDFLDGDLEEARASRVKFHLDWCKPCADFLESYRDTGPLCKKALAREMPPEIKTKLFEALRQELSCDKPHDETTKE